MYLVSETPLTVPGNSFNTLHIGSYISAHVVLTLLNSLGKRELNFFRNEFDRFNNTSIIQEHGCTILFII